MGRALALRPVVHAWSRVRLLYSEATGPGEKEGLAVTLAATATEAHLDDLVALLRDQSRGPSRVHLLSAIKRIGGQRGQDVLDSLTSHPLFGDEASTPAKTRT